MKKLHISDDLALPLDTVTQTIGILAKKRAGKSFTARRLTEQLIKAGQQVVIVDPKGDWWGIRSAANGKDVGLPIVILGGERHDVKLEPSAGEVVAKLVVEERVSALLDLSLLRKHEVATFMATFLEQLYRLKAREEFRTPMMLMIDEADAIAPQSPKSQGSKGGNVERMLGAAEDIVRRGGQRGIGCTMVTQRSAVLNKNVLTQIQILVALRTIAPQDLDALNAWIDVHGTQEQRKTLMESLPSLPVGDAWVWSPGWPTDDGIFKRIHVEPIETFDSGATPKPGEKRREPKMLAEVDLDALQRQMAETIQRAKAEDPRELKKTIAELRQKVAAAERAKPAAPAAKAPRTVEKPVLKDAQVKRLEAAIARLEKLEAQAVYLATRTEDRLREIRAALAAAQGTTPARGRGIDALIPDRVTPPRPPAAPPRAPRPVRAAAGGGDVTIGSGERAVLTAVAQHTAAGGASREQLSILTAYKRSSRDTYLQRLRAAGLVDQVGDLIVATEAGMAALGPDFEPLPIGDALREHWLGRLPEGERRVFEVVCAAYPNGLERDAIDEATNYKRSSRDTYLQRLGARKLVLPHGRGEVRAADELFG